MSGTSTIRKVLKEKPRLMQLSVEERERNHTMPTIVHLLDLHVIQPMAFCEGKVHLPGRIIIDLAKMVAELLRLPNAEQLRFTRRGWLRHFLARYSLERKRSYGEADSVDAAVVAAAVTKLRQQIGQYHPSDVFNMDEAAYFYKAVPRTSLCLKSAPTLKQSKSCLTFVVGANASGTEKLPLMIIGSAHRSRWLPGKPAGVNYVGTKKGRMTVAAFQAWFLDLNERVAHTRRKTLLLFDNAPVHIDLTTPPSNIQVLQLPKSTTAVLQPMDQGVITRAKREVLTMRSDLALYTLLAGDDDPYQVGVLDCVEWLESVWEKIGADTIRNCWKHSGLFVDRLAVADLLL